MIVNPDIEKFIDHLLPARDPVLAAMEAFAADRRIPIVGPAVGTVLAQLVLVSGAKRIFELGSAIGYSTIWLARAAGPDAEVHYSDGSQENARLARENFERAGVADRIEIHVGDALECLQSTDGQFDLIFNDIDKEGYPASYMVVPDRLSRRGLFVTDNALWHERVLNPPDDTSRAVVDFDQKLFSDKEFLTSILPIRDGLLVAVKYS